MTVGTTGLVIRGNYIGVSASGARLGNGTGGAYLSQCSQVVVGGTNSDARNVISGNPVGVFVDQCASNTVRFNYIGLNEAGAVVSNNTYGIIVDQGRGHDLSDNVVSGNGQYGVYLHGTAGCTLKRNLLGTDPSGTADCGNGYFGLYMEGGASNNVVGGRWGDEGNVISGNELGGVNLEGAATRNNILRGNRVGTDILGMTAISNRYSGISVLGSPLNTIGSSTNTQERNVISGNAGQGVEIGLSNSFGNVIAGNCIGTDVTATNRLPNTGGGIWIHDASSNTVGGAAIGALNCIAYNGGSGIQVESGDGNTLFNNSIFRNGVLGIDLGLGTPTTNDPGDADIGPNRQQNYPVLVSVSNNGTQIRVVWTLDTVPSTNFILEFYGSTGPDQSPYGEGEYPLGWVGPVTTPAAALLGGTNLFATPNPPPNFITALATHMGLLDTSEFSQRILLDSDKDGMGDGYEAVHFGGHTNGQPGADADFDTVSNLDEFRADTNPEVMDSYPHIKRVAVSGNSFSLTTPYSPDRGYAVQTCTDLRPAGSGWANRNATLTPAGGEAVLTGTTATNTAAYRVIWFVP
jgi:parallel beta-helix repeat protein